jgi:sugar phosphate isomerase/epimerase
VRENAIGICASVTQAPVLAAAGADFIEENVQRFLVPLQPDAAFRPLPAALPVYAANSFLPGDLKCVGPAVDSARLRQYATTAFRRARQAGIEVIVFGSGGARQIPDGFSHREAEQQFVALLRTLGPLAGDHGVMLVVEPLNQGECNFINSVAEAAALVEAAGQPHVRVLADFYHMMRDGQSPADIVTHGKLLRHVHIAERAKRTPPGTAGDDFRPYLTALRQIGYRGAICIESQWSDLAAEAAGGVQSLRQQWAQTAG